MFIYLFDFSKIAEYLFYTNYKKNIKIIGFYNYFNFSKIFLLKLINRKNLLSYNINKY